MKTYLIETTRSERAERPSEDTIYNDSVLAKLGKFNEISQDMTKDTFFLVKGDIDVELTRLSCIQGALPMWFKAGDGFRVIKYPHSEKWTRDFTHLSEELETEDEEGNTTKETRYAEVQVQLSKESESSVEIFNGENAMTDALELISTLNSSDGYVLIQEWKNKSIVVFSRPSLWEPSTVMSNPNLLGREDKDRY